MENSSILFDCIVNATIGNTEHNENKENVHDNSKYETYRLKIKVDNDDKTNVELHLDSHLNKITNTIVVKLEPTMKLSPTLKKFAEFSYAEEYCKDAVQKIPDIVISNGFSHDNIITINFPFKYNDIDNDVSYFIDKTREDIVSNYKKCHCYLRERLAEIILMDSLNNPCKDKLIKAIDNVGKNKLLSKEDILLKRVLLVYELLSQIEDWNETHALKVSKDDDALDRFLNLNKDPLLLEQDVKALESYGEIQWIEKMSSPKVSPLKVSISSKITSQDVSKATVLYREQSENLNFSKIVGMLLFIIVSSAIMLFKNSNNAVSSNEISIGLSAGNTNHDIDYVSKFSKTFVMNSISNSNTKNVGRALKMNIDYNEHSKIMIHKMTETIYHIKNVFKNPFDFIFGVKKVIDKLVDAVSEHFAKLFNFSKHMV